MKVLLFFRQSQNVTGEKLCKALLYKKGAHKTLMKYTPVWQNVYLSDSCDRDGNTLARVNVIAGNL